MKLVIFDFDGVLANTGKLCYEIHKIKNQDLTWEHFQEFSAGNFYDGYDKAVQEGRHTHPDNFFDEYKKGLDVLTIEEILHNSVISLAQKFRLSIISSTNSSYISDFLAKENISNYFSDVLGADVHRSKTFKIKTILEKYNLSPDSAVFITDTLGDIKEADECGVKSVGVTWGLHDKSILKKGNPVEIIDNPQDLIGAIENVLK